MSPEIEEYFRCLLGEVQVPPGPIILPDGLTAFTLAKIIHQTMVCKASMQNEVRHVQTLFRAWAILNDAQAPMAALAVKSVQTDGAPLLGPCVCRPPDVGEAAQHTATTVLRGALSAPNPAVQTHRSLRPSQDSAVQTESSLCTLRHSAVQTGSGLGTLRDSAAQTARIAAAEAASQTPPAAATRQAGSQTMLRRGFDRGTQTARGRPVWALRPVAGAPRPPAPQAAGAVPQSFHGRRLRTRTDGSVSPPEIPLQRAASAGSAPCDPRVVAPDSTSSLSPGMSGKSALPAAGTRGDWHSPVGEGVDRPSPNDGGVDGTSPSGGVRRHPAPGWLNSVASCTAAPPPGPGPEARARRPGDLSSPGAGAGEPKPRPSSDRRQGRPGGCRSPRDPSLRRNGPAGPPQPISGDLETRPRGVTSQPRPQHACPPINVSGLLKLPARPGGGPAVELPCSFPGLLRAARPAAGRGGGDADSSALYDSDMEVVSSDSD